MATKYAKDTHLGLRLEAGVKDRLQLLADLEGRSMSSMAAMALNGWVRREITKPRTLKALQRTGRALPDTPLPDAPITAVVDVNDHGRSA